MTFDTSKTVGGTTIATGNRTTTERVIHLQNAANIMASNITFAGAEVISASAAGIVADGLEVESHTYPPYLPR